MPPVKPLKLGHLVLRVRDLDRAIGFYRDLLGLEGTGRRGDRMAFLSLGEESHDLALLNIGQDAPGPDPHRVGLYHFAYRMESMEALKEAYGFLKEQGVNIVGFGDHGISWGVYLTDPDDNEIELYYELPKEQWQEQRGVLFAGGSKPFVLD